MDRARLLQPSRATVSAWSRRRSRATTSRSNRHELARAIAAAARRRSSSASARRQVRLRIREVREHLRRGRRLRVLWGWQFGIGVVALILIHEWATISRRGAWGSTRSCRCSSRSSARTSRSGRAPDAWQPARIALAGPFVGAIGAAVVWVVGEAHDSPLLQALGYTGFFLNLFNLVPIGFLDGGQSDASPSTTSPRRRAAQGRRRRRRSTSVSPGSSSRA